MRVFTNLANSSFSFHGLFVTGTENHVQNCQVGSLIGDLHLIKIDLSLNLKQM